MKKLTLKEELNLSAGVLLKELDWSAVDRVYIKTVEEIETLMKNNKGECSHEEWNWLKSLKKATLYLFNLQKEGKLILSEEIKAYALLNALGNNIPTKFKEEFNK